MQTAGLMAVDLDGTLITDHGRITGKVYSALERAVENGWEIVIASGRTFYAARQIIEKLPFIRYAVLSNGACIIKLQDDSIMHMETLESGLAKNVVESIRSHGAIPALYTTDIMNQRVYYDSLERACTFFKWYVKKDTRCELVDNVMDYIDDVLQIGMIDEKKTVLAIRDTLKEFDVRVMALPFESAHFGGKNNDYWFMQTVHKNATKSNALRRLAGWIDIPDGRLVAVGDNYNDADMIENADIGVAMGNSPDEIKKLANVIVATNNDSGLSQVVDEVILSGKYFTETY